MDLKTGLLFLTHGTFYTVRLSDYYRCFERLLMHAVPTPSPSAHSEPVCDSVSDTARDAQRQYRSVCHLN